MNIKNIFRIIVWIVSGMLIATFLQYIEATNLEGGYGWIENFFVWKTGIIVGGISSMVQLAFYHRRAHREEKDALRLNVMRFLDLLIIILGFTFVSRLFT